MTTVCDEPRILTTREVARLTGFSIQKVRLLIAAGRLPAANTSSGGRARWCVRREDLEKLLSPTCK